MRLHPRSFWFIVGPALLVLLSVAFGGSRSASDPIIDPAPVYLPAIVKNYPNLLPPPLEARKVGWLRKWPESQTLEYCLQVSGTPYYLEREPGEAGWLAAVAETETVPDVALEVHLGEKVAITGTAEYLDAACDFPRLNARKLEVIAVSPDGTSGH